MTEPTPDQEIPDVAVDQLAVTTAEPMDLPPVPPPPFKWGWTLFFAVGAILLIVWSGWSRLTREPMDNIWYPADTPIWLVDRDMILHDVLTAKPSLVRLMQRFFLPDDPPEASERMLREAINHVQSLPKPEPDLAKLRSTLIILLAETGEYSRAEPELNLLDNSETSRMFATAVRLAYQTKSPLPYITFTNDTGLLGSEWAHQKLSARLELLAGHHDSAARRSSWLRTEGAELKNALAFVSVTLLGIVAIGFVCGFNVAKDNWLPRSVNGPLPWSMHEGFGMFVRSLFVGLAIYMAGYWFLTYFPVESIGYLFVHARAFLMWWAVLLFLFIRWRRPGQSIWPMFGMDPGNPRWFEMVKLGLVLFAILFCAEHALLIVFQKIGIEPHWAEALDEYLLYGEREWQKLGVFDGVVSAPVLEELLFRGLLFGGLRRRFSFWPAALISGACFAGVHFYSLPGFSTVMLGAVLSAYFYERTGSLIPCIVAHALINTFWFWPLLWIYGT